MTRAGDGGDPVGEGTPRTWIAERLEAGASGRRQLNRFIMRMHAEPLAAFVRWTRWRALGDPDDLVRGFFADRLSREEFLHKWMESGKSFRQWLGNALVFHLKEEERRRRRDGLVREPVDELADDLARAERELDRAFAIRLVRTALRTTRRDLGRRGLAAHFDVFHAHEWEGVPYQEAGARVGVGPDRARVMARTARDAFRHVLRDLLRRDGCRPSAVDQALADLLDALD